MRRAAITAVACAVAVSIPPAAALAHSEVVSTSPKSSGSASTKITKVTVTFSGPMRSGTIRVTGPGGGVVSIGRGGSDPRNVNRLTVSLKRGLKVGRYTATWTAKAADGHAQRGSFRFRLKR